MSIHRPVVFAAAVLAIVTGHAAATRAALIVTESFDYAGVGVAGQNGGAGWVSSTWQPLTTGSNLTLSSDDQSLAYPTPVAYTPVGERIHSTAGGVSRQFGAGNSLDFQNASGKSYYISVLVRKDDAGSFTIRTNNSSNQPRFHFGIDASERFFTNLFNNNQYSAAGAAAIDETILIVARFFNGGPAGGETDRVQLVAYQEGDAIPADEPTSWLVTTPGNTSVFQQQLEIVVSAGSVQIDEIRIGAEWADVIAVPEPAGAALSLLGLLLVTTGGRRVR